MVDEFMIIVPAFCIPAAPMPEALPIIFNIHSPFIVKTAVGNTCIPALLLDIYSTLLASKVNSSPNPSSSLVITISNISAVYFS